MERNKIMLDLRPILSLEQPASQNNVKRFQNSTIRPIVKFQHDNILSMVQNHKFYSSAMKNINTLEEHRVKIKSFLTGQKDLRHQLFGLVIALFTSEELETYFLNQAEYQRRIIQIIAQRVLDTVGPNSKQVPKKIGTLNSGIIVNG
jgi:hypothetical protein